MAIEAVCSKYGTELTELGGLVFSPPKPENLTHRDKYHLSVRAWKEFLVWRKPSTTLTHYVAAHDVGIAFEPPKDVGTVSEVGFHYLGKARDWAEFLLWLLEPASEEEKAPLDDVPTYQEIVGIICKGRGPQCAHPESIAAREIMDLIAERRNSR